MKWRRRLGFALFLVSAIKLVGCAYILWGTLDMSNCEQVRHLTGIVGVISAFIWMISGVMLAKR